MDASLGLDGDNARGASEVRLAQPPSLLGVSSEKMCRQRRSARVATAIPSEAPRSSANSVAEQ